LVATTKEAMTMNTTLVIAFIYLGFCVLISSLIYVPYWRSGVPVPGYHHGGTAASIGPFFLLLAVGMEFKGQVTIVLVILSAILSFGGAAIVSRARRQMKSRSQYRNDAALARFSEPR
jgi:hypothetical protein